MAKDSKGITTSKSEDIATWYSQVVQKAELADYAPVKGCMIIRPYGYQIWENIQAYFNKRLRFREVPNAYFPLFIPESFFYKEAQHAQGFKPEVAWIANTYEGERIAIRPTSETIMYDSFSKWIRSHRDLPFRINQWCNIVRWETEATKMFLRTREFLWQEGHCAYETDEECERETLLFLEEYKKLVEEQLAMPVIIGKKTEKEKFAGAKFTTTIEAFMPDGKALQCGTSHHLGQGFAKSFEIQFKGKDEKLHYPYQSSWGFSTRLIGAIVMQHGDDKGLIMPPRIAPIQAVIVPILFDESKELVLNVANEIKEKLSHLRISVDKREEYSPGWKFNEYEMKGVPIRIEIGPRDVEQKQAVVVRRDTKEKEIISIDKLEKRIPELLDSIHDSLFNKAKQFMESNIIVASNWEEFLNVVNQSKIAFSPWCGETECEILIKDKTSGVSSRCIPFNDKVKEDATCVHCDKKAKHTIYFSRSY